MRIEIVHNDPEDCSREQSKEPRCELEHSKDSSAKTRWRANRGQPYYSAGPTSQQPKQMVNALAMSAGVRCPELTRLGPMRLLNEDECPLLALSGHFLLHRECPLSRVKRT